MKFQIGDWVTTEGWGEYFQVTGVTTDGNKILLKEDDAEEWYSSEGFTKKGNEMQESNKVKPDEFRVGDVVWCVLYGKGEVSSIMGNPEKYTYPMEVCFENEDVNWYTLDGKLDEMGNRTLFFSEPKIEASATRPFVPTLVGKTVIVQYFDDTFSQHPVVITDETKDEIFSLQGSDYKTDLLAIYELSSENLLKKD